MTSVDFEIYDHQMGAFSPLPAEDLITLDTSFHGTWPEAIPGHDVFMVAPMYDIPVTMIRALKVFARNYPDAYAVIQQSSKGIQEIEAAATGIKLLVEATLAPIDAMDRDEWQRQTISRSMAAGCVGALIDCDPVELDAYDPDATFLRRMLS